MDIAGIFDKAAEEMRLYFEKARITVTHPGIKGTSLEEVFREFLRKYLPLSLDISTGVLVDAHGNNSCQLDVIIYDRAQSFVFHSIGDYKIIPIECAYAVIEVKSKLDSNELKNVFQNMESVRKLKKTAYYKPLSSINYSVHLYGEIWDIWPINYYVFAYDSIKLTTLAKQIDEKHKSKSFPEHSRIDTVCVLNKGIICNINEDGQIDALPTPRSELKIRETSRWALLLFHSLTSVYFNHARLPVFRFIDYLDKLNLDD